MLTYLPMDEEKRDENMTEDGSENDGLKVYEIGFLLAPTVAEEKLPEEVSALKSVIEERGGFFISEDFPKLRPLAYTMVKKIDNKNQKYNQAYFGWVKFELKPSEVPVVNSSFQNNLNVIRFILLDTVRENTIYSHKLTMKRDREARGAGPATAEVSSKSEEVSPEELDKSIEKLVSTG